MKITLLIIGGALYEWSSGKPELPRNGADTGNRLAAIYG